jgi:hypothetical protein
MRKRSVWMTGMAVLVAAVAIATGIAVAAREKPTVIRAGNLVLTINGGVTPKALPKKGLAAISFRGMADLATIDGSHPPAFEESRFEVDRDVVVDVGGIPTCRKAQLANRSTADAKAACPEAILGAGRGAVEVAFPDQTPIHASGPLFLFNGGERGGVTTFYIHAYVAIPAPTAIVATVTARRISNGPYGLLFGASLPLIAGGSGSPTHFEIHTFRFVRDRSGHKRGFLFARCSDGHLQAKGSATFRDGTTLFGAIARACQPVG